MWRDLCLHPGEAEAILSGWRQQYEDVREKLLDGQSAAEKRQPIQLYSSECGSDARTPTVLSSNPLVHRTTPQTAESPLHGVQLASSNHLVSPALKSVPSADQSQPPHPASVDRSLDPHTTQSNPSGTDPSPNTPPTPPSEPTVTVPSEKAPSRDTERDTASPSEECHPPSLCPTNDSVKEPSADNARPSPTPSEREPTVRVSETESSAAATAPVNSAAGIADEESRAPFVDSELSVAEAGGQGTGTLVDRPSDEESEAPKPIVVKESQQNRFVQNFANIGPLYT